MEERKRTKRKWTSQNRIGIEALSGKNVVSSCPMSPFLEESTHFKTRSPGTYHGDNELLARRQNFLDWANNQSFSRISSLAGTTNAIQATSQPP